MWYSKISYFFICRIRSGLFAILFGNQNFAIIIIDHLKKKFTFSFQNKTHIILGQYLYRIDYTVCNSPDQLFSILGRFHFLFDNNLNWNEELQMEHAVVVHLLRRNKSCHLKWGLIPFGSSLLLIITDYFVHLDWPGCFFLITRPEGWWINPGWSWFVFLVSVDVGWSFGSNFSSACRRKIMSWSNIATQWAFVESWAPIVSGSRCFFFCKLRWRCARLLWTRGHHNITRDFKMMLNRWHQPTSEVAQSINLKLHLR